MQCERVAAGDEVRPTVEGLLDVAEVLVFDGERDPVDGEGVPVAVVPADGVEQLVCVAAAYRGWDISPWPLGGGRPDI